MEAAQKQVLSRLFRLKYREGIITSLELADCLNLPVDETITYERLLDAELHRKLGSITTERLQLICSECLSPQMCSDPETGERSCRACGVVDEQSIEDLDDSLPFDTTYAPTTAMAVCKSVGDTLQQPKEQQQVLGVGTFSNGNNEDLPLRAKQVRIMTRTEHPVRQ
jgi:hypothetical protein